LHCHIIQGLSLKRLNQLFHDADIRQKQRTLQFLLYNAQLFNQKLSFELIYPYKALQKLNFQLLNDPDSINWYKLCDRIIASAQQLDDSPLLKELASDFNLADNLLTV